MEKLRPKDKLKRADSTFAFVQLSDAYIFLKQHGGYLYEVELNTKMLSNGKNSHIGDMAIIEFINQITCSALRKEWIIKYWKGEMSYKPCIEVLTDKVVVKRVLTDYGKPLISKSVTKCFHKYMVEYDKEYISLLDKIQS